MAFVPCLVRSTTAAGVYRYSLGDPLIDSYLDERAFRSLDRSPVSARSLGWLRKEVLSRAKVSNRYHTSVINWRAW